MKENTDDVLSTVDSTKRDEILTKRAKIEGIFGERESEDMVVDVVSADVVVERETGAQDHVMEDVDVVKEGDGDVVESRVESLEKVEVVVSEEGVKGSVEVVKEAVKENVVVTVVSGSGCDEQKSGNGPVIGDSEEGKAGGGEAEVRESVQEVVDEKTQKETEVLDLPKIPESAESQAVTEEGLVGKDKAEDCVDQTKKENFESTAEATTNDSQKLGNSERVVESDRGVTEETVGQPTEPVQEAADVDCVMSEKTGKDEILDSTKISDSVTKVDEVITKEGLAGKGETQDGESEDQSKIVNIGTREHASVDENAEVNQKNKEESSTIEDSKSGKETEVGDSKMDDAPEIVKGEIDVIDQGDGDQDSSKISQSSIMVSLGLEEVDVVVVDEGLEGKNEKQDPVSVEPSMVNPHDQSISTEVVNVGPGEVDQTIEVDSTSKDDSSLATIKPDEVTIAQKEPNSDVQVSTDGGILVENQRIDINVVTDSSKPDVVAYTEPHQTHTEHGVLPANSEFSYEDAHMERGEDAGMDIDEVLGWKDEIPPVQEDEPKVDPTNLSNVEMPTLESEPMNKTLVSLKQSCYFHPPANEGEFSVSDLVWGKVRSHPWWPGQIFDPSDASEKAMKHYKKDCFLVAYFGDRTFAWNDSAVLKPFRENFSQIVGHTDSEAFDNAVHCALQEVSRRVELGLTCSCIPREIYENIKCQIVENSGIKQESSRRHGVDKSASVSSFEPDMLVDYVRLLAKVPFGEGDKLELTIAKAQLSSYGRFKGHRQLAEFQSCGDLLEAEQVIKDETYPEDGSKKRKALASIPDGSKPSFNVGGSIQKVASQLTGPGSAQLGDQADMLSQLHRAAQDPMKGYGFVNNIIPFFNSHRATVLSKSSLNSPNDGRKRKTSNENHPEDFEYDDVNDSYWTDRIIQNNSEENPLQENQNGGGAHQIVAYEQEKQLVKPARRSNKKRFFSSNHEIEAKEQSELIERRRKNLATEVLMKFTEGVYFPSEIHLNKMFRRFGPLVESETEVDRQSGRARVVFKKCSDAEVAHSSAGKFNIFGSINVHYELNYTPLISYKPLPLPTQDPANAC